MPRPELLPAYCPWRLFMKRSMSVLAVCLMIALLAAPAQVRAEGNAPERVCPGPAGPGTARCHAVARPNASLSPTGLSPARIISVYSFSTSSTAGAGKTIAIVDAYDDPTTESDLGVFSTQFGLPAC